MQLTLTADYAARVMIHLASLPVGERASRDILAEASQTPTHFLSKILQSLARSGLIVSRRGASGGFALARPADQLTLLDVLEAIEGPLALNRCLEKSTPCSRSTWCGAHLVWARAQAALIEVLRSATLTELARQSHPLPPLEVCVLTSGTAGSVPWN
ncbi:MAG: Rrf2 family transcriptional regulator [Bryobacterales bacterium]|nr:Rrf2 family transcriptional regulator [Bryobacterales bacterium]